MAVLMLMLLLALPACGQVGKITIESFPHMHIDTLRAPTTYRWVTVRVDSLNLGVDPCGVSLNQIATRGGHDWVNSPEYFLTEARLPTIPEGRWTERGRERICRLCLRHEWQAQKAVPPKPVLSPFDSLKALLQSPRSAAITSDTALVGARSITWGPLDYFTVDQSITDP